MSEPTPIHPTHHVHEAPPLHDAADEWHDHSHDERPQQPHAAVGNIPLIMGVGTALFLLILLAVVIVDVFYRGFASDELAKLEVSSPNGPALLARQEKSDAFLYQQAKEPRWVTIPAAGEVPAKNVIQIPIADAIDRVVADYAPQIGERSGAASADTANASK